MSSRSRVAANFALTALALLAAGALLACGDADNSGGGGGPPGTTPNPKDPRNEIFRTHGIRPQVWSQLAPGVASYEFKVNCERDSERTEECLLTDLTDVTVIAPDGQEFVLERDFNVNDYSGEVTRRWVLYGPPDGELPLPGEYQFRYQRHGEMVLEHVLPYTPDQTAYPTAVEWTREGADLHVTWETPKGVEGTGYKVILWNLGDTPDAFASLAFPWGTTSAVLPDLPFVAGGQYSLNVAAYFDHGYAYSEYITVDW